MGNTETKTLHELVTKNFCRTPNGLIHTYDLKTVYSVFLICLDLQEEEVKPKKWVPFFPKLTHQFSFSVGEAVDTMKDLELQVDIGTTYVNISYKIHPELACFLLETFMTAKLLHTPADRTRNKPKEKVLLQPTAKGVCILQKYVRDIGMREIPRILLSEFNSMDLFIFERDPLTDSIIHNDCLIRLLFTRLMGSCPNVWSPQKPQDKITALRTLVEYNNNDFTFEDVKYSYQRDVVGSEETEEKNKYHSSKFEAPDLTMDDDYRTSPFAHKFFTNPESDAHVQYYVSDSGLRLFKSKIFGPKKTLIDYCFSTKALWQWLMDCTDVMYPKEAVSVASLFLKAGLIVPIYLPPSKNTKKKFQIHKLSFYTLAQRGWDSVRWNTDEGINQSINNILQEQKGEPITSGQEKGIDKDDEVTKGMTISKVAQPKTLDQILNDPGMRYLFRKHLENEFCAENLDAYLDIQKLLGKMELLTKPAAHCLGTDHELSYQINGHAKKVTNIANSVLDRHANECLEMVYHVYSSYIMVNSPYTLNIDHNLRESITKILLHPHSPVSGVFPPMDGNAADNSVNESKSETENLSIDILDSSLAPSLKVTRSSSKMELESEKTPVENLEATLDTDHLIQPSNWANLLKEKSDSSHEAADVEKKTPSSTCDKNVTNITKMLVNVHPQLNMVQLQLLHIMRRDCLQKFLYSRIYTESFHPLIDNSQNLE